MNINAINELKFDDNGLIPAITQDNKTNQILMLAWMNKESIKLSIKRKQAVYYSRSRKRLWHKGRDSGYFQSIINIYTDCDQDTILLSVKQYGGISCHTGRKSCFYRYFHNQKWQNID